MLIHVAAVWTLAVHGVVHYARRVATVEVSRTRQRPTTAGLPYGRKDRIVATQDNDSELLTATSAGGVLNISGYAVRSLADRGRLACIRDSSGRRLYRRADVEQLKRERAARSAGRE